MRFEQVVPVAHRDLPDLREQRLSMAQQQVRQRAVVREFALQHARAHQVIMAGAQYHCLARRASATRKRCDADHAFIARDGESCRCPAFVTRRRQTTPEVRKCRYSWSCPPFRTPDRDRRPSVSLEWRESVSDPIRRRNRRARRCELPGGRLPPVADDKSGLRHGVASAGERKTR